MRFPDFELEMILSDSLQNVLSAQSRRLSCSHSSSRFIVPGDGSFRGDGASAREGSADLRSLAPERVLPTRDASPLRYQRRRLSGIESVPQPSKYSTNGPILAHDFSAQQPNIAWRNIKNAEANLFSWLAPDIDAPPRVSMAFDQFLHGSSCNILELFQSRYDLTGVKLGSGKHSDVIQVENKKDGSTYAAKVISLSCTSEAKIRREVAAMTKIHHTNSAQIVDVLQCREQLPGISTKPPYALIVMTQINGEPLSNAIIRDGPNPALACQFLLQISEVLATMHRHMCVHRDIWSENILVDQHLHMHLIDFGCVGICDAPSENLTADAMLNIPYLSPSSKNKDSQPCPSDDMWSLGLVLTEVVTGQPVMFRMGRSDVPFYFRSDLLQNALDETLSLGGEFLGRLACGLLTSDKTERLRAEDVLALCRLSSGIPRPDSTFIGTATPRYSIAPSVGSARAGPSRSCGQRHMDFIPVPCRKTAKHPVLDLTPGQNVIYEASTHKGSYASTVIGRAANKDAWLVELQIGGVKVVSDAESWRLTPT